ncbi:MAG: AbrB family transcriptional regulator [Candidatus Synechococcus spongiarum 15L]|uniref:AbrB family transcriptional regulator n=3 Tax=Candidatus Synechococcus spongiarum TaxID=431041 RepID=A0A1T1CRZ6_9SYNE|nr:AbrB family transcriptional regulator [Candidatus Synechococcus spongiarum]KKZ13882.1 MAG: AbrB family transcriptional regulator [Candidatus Synechococcus spongiarum 15L]OOV31320.1 AbrB family transcriptional regulator [Candidatus Synechococcus spongiarum LMB bulk15M]OOV34059.1 AbrB family transcriptional regulator [Candidatus Synechococcus spongiarum LMB bulk15N]
MLTKTELLNKVRELADASKSDVVRACGYVSTTKDGRERLNFTAFYEAVLDAKGVEIGGGGGSKSGRKLSFMTKIQGNGNLLIGKAYTKKLGLNPGDEFEIKLGRKNIRLVPLGSEDDGGEE